ncbi:MAG: glycosyltransferase family 4 protein [Deltaproteobacteria bacterium]|nr:glycosyltransferase family 4 protein [Deltaproteobacteria bacterium]
MRVIIATVQVPFIVGGAELHARNLEYNLRQAGHEVEIVTFPFKFTPERYISYMMSFISNIHFDNFGWVSVDKLIALRFPAYYVNHENKVVWLLHQHRAVYDLYDDSKADEGLKELKTKIHQFDTASLAKCKHIYANSQNVANRLKHYNQIESTPLYHPPHDSEKLYCAEPYPYIFYPSRLEHLKRQDLIIEAMRHVKSDVRLIIAGVGGKQQDYEALIQRYQLQERIAMLGHISDAEKNAYYAHALAVAYPPYDEDYGYITLEAMLSSKPIITCTDSGGPLEFVVDGENGYVVPPDPLEIAEKIDQLVANKQRAIDMGRNSRALYNEKNISWDNVVQTLLYGQKS